MDPKPASQRLSRARVDVVFFASDPAQVESRALGSEMRRISARLDRWTEALLSRVLTAPLSDDCSQRGEVVVGIVRAFEARFAGLVAPDQVKISLPEAVEEDQAPSREDDPEAEPIEIRFAVRASWEQIEEFEEVAVEYLAELFDGNAALTLEESRGGETFTVELSRGGSEAEAPIFGLDEPADLLIIDSMQRRADLRFDANSDSLAGLMGACPAAMRATPGGRRDLALLFVEGAMQDALLTAGDKVGECVLTDYTQAHVNRIEARITTWWVAISAEDAARHVRSKWPNIFLPCATQVGLLNRSLN